MLEKLGTLKSNNKALDGGKNAADYLILNTNNENVLCFNRSKNKASIYFIGNFSDKTQTFTMAFEGSFTDVLTDQNIVFDKKEIELKAWEYYLIQNK